MSGQSLQLQMDHADKVLTMLRSGQISPTPLNYELIYRYVSGSDPTLSELLDKEAAKGTPFNSGLVERVRRQLYGRTQTDETSNIIDSTHTQLGIVASYLQTASEDARDYSTQLKSGERSLADFKPSNGQESVVSEMLSATSDMIERTQKLEARLAVSAQEIMVLKRDLERARSESRTDPLTGLANRKAFDMAIEMQAARALVDKRPFCVAFCDIDHFKAFNDTWGHALGDEVLRLVAHCLERLSHGVGMAARYGGEEFVVLMPQKELNAAVDISEQICDYVSSRKIRSRTGNLDLGRVTLSIGVAQLKWDDTIDVLMERADAALYQAKEKGRNQVRTELDLPAGGKVSSGKVRNVA